MQEWVKAIKNWTGKCFPELKMHFYSTFIILQVSPGKYHPGRGRSETIIINLTHAVLEIIDEFICLDKRSDGIKEKIIKRAVSDLENISIMQQSVQR